MSGAGGSTPDEAAEDVFVAWLAEDEGVRGDLAALCARHPGLAPALRELGARWDVAAHARAAALPPEDDGGPARPAPLRAVVARLSAQGAASAERYRDEGELARGAQGVVRRSFDTLLRRHVAMKVLHGREAPEVPGARGSGGSRRLGRFLDEAQVTAQLEHPAIVPVHELGLDAQGAVYFTMKLVKGRSLHDVLAARGAGSEGEWTLARLVGVLQRVAEAMAFAHDRGVVHRDLKPSNVMLGDYGEVYVMDWGLARVAGGDAPRPAAPADAVRSDRREAAGAAPGSSLLTLEGDVVGTPQYMAPEQAAGDLSRLGPAADVYALGAMLYHVLAGRAPYAPAGPSTPLDLLALVRAGPPAPLRQAAPHAPPELLAICEQAMARDPALRYAGMAALGADLRAFLERRVVRAYEAGPLAELRKWVLRNPALAATGAAVLLAVIGGLAWVSRVESAGRRRAEQAQGLADRSLADVLRLSDLQRLERLRKQADTLWPAEPQFAGALQAWLDEARDLLAREDSHRATLDVLATRALPLTEAEARADREDPRLLDELRVERESLATLEGMLADEDSRPQPDADRRRVILRKSDDRRQSIARVEAALASRRTWRFAAEEDAWWHATLGQLLDGLRSFEAAVVPSVERRLDRALSLERVSLVEPAAAWEEALASIADPAQCPAYGGLSLQPQLGLVPLGRNPASGLWEFWDVQLGERPARDAAGRLVIRPETGVVFVLLPGGEFLCGGQSADPAAPNFDPWSRIGGGTRTQLVRLDPFFMAAHELTQAQWERATGRNPSIYYCPGESVGNAYTETNPVESVTWTEARDVPPCFGWILPTEAQWEYACRAGSATTWWTGAQAASLQGAANVADAFLGRHAGELWPHDAALDDGHSAHAPVGRYRPNAFGLFDMHGNVSEWARDAFHEVPADMASGEGLQAGGNLFHHPARGGSFGQQPAEATSAARQRVQTGMRSGETGVRVVRRVRAGG